MSTRWYPLYRRGNPQLRIFLPNFWVKLVRPKYKQPPNVVQFIVSSEMTLHDVRNYLEKIYKVPVAHVSTGNVSGRTRRNPVGNYIIKDDDYKVAFVTLQEGSVFEFPEVYPEDKEKEKIDKSMDEVKDNFKKFLNTNRNRPGVPGEFTMVNTNPYVKQARSDWSRLHKKYDPLMAGSIDGTDTEPHDHGVVRAMNAEYFPDKGIRGDPECTIFVSKLSKATSERNLKKAFSHIGRIRRCRVIKDIVTGAHQGYGFIEFEDSASASLAYTKCNKMTVDGVEIFVDFECERLLTGWKPRRLGGGFGGKKESGQLRFGGRARPFKKPLVPYSKSMDGKKEVMKH